MEIILMCLKFLGGQEHGAKIIGGPSTLLNPLCAGAYARSLVVDDVKACVLCAYLLYESMLY